MSSAVSSSRNLAILLLAGGLIGAGLRAAVAGVPVTGPYVSLGAGIDLQQDETLKPIQGLEPRREVHLDLPGFAGDASAGYGFGNGLRVELEGNYFNDHVRKISFPGDEIRRAGGYQQQYGGFANVLYDISVALPVTPYVGVGIGGQIMEFDNLNSSTPGFRFPCKGGASEIGSFAYQAIAGVSLPVPYVRGLALTAEYRFVGLPDPSDSIPFEVFSARTGELKGEGREQFGNVFHHSILFGLRYAFDTAPPPPPFPPPVAPAAPPAEARTYLVFFDWDRSVLTARAREIVAQAAQASTHVQTTRVEVDGYTDTSSIHGGARGARYNQGLSIRRATSVKAELIRDGVPGTAIDIHGYGETHPLVATGPNTREPQNRRVEIILH